MIIVTTEIAVTDNKDDYTITMMTMMTMMTTMTMIIVTTVIAVPSPSSGSRNLLRSFRNSSKLPLW